MRAGSLLRMGIDRIAVPAAVLLAALYAHTNAAALHAAAGDALGLPLEALATSLGVLRWGAGAWLVNCLVTAFISGTHRAPHAGVAPPRNLLNFVTGVILVIAAIAMLRVEFDREITGLVATSGVLTVVVGFAIREMIADFFGGLALNFEQPYRIGDWLELEPGLVARVTELNWRATRLVTLDHRTVIVPNGNLASRQFINYSAPERVFREAIDIVLDFSVPPARAENVLLAAVLSTDGLAEGRTHQVRIKGFGERGVLYEVRFWINDYGDRASLRHRISASILRQLTHAGISIPHEQHEIFMSRERRLREERRIEPHRLLSRVPWLATLDAPELEPLGAIASGREFAAGEVVVRQGDTGKTLGFLVEGLLEASVTTPEGRDTKVGLIEPGDAFGEMSFLTGAPRAATVTARTDGYALEIRPLDFEPILRARPALAGELGRLMPIRGLSLRQAVESGDAHTETEVVTRAGQIAKRISAFFGLAARESD